MDHPEKLDEGTDDLIFGDLAKKWNSSINSLATLVGVPVAIIFKKEGDKIRVLVTNDNTSNPFNKGDTIPIEGSFCNYVFKSNRKFVVADYRSIDLDINNVASQADFISYLGFPLSWPNGEYFGTICLLDDTTNYFSESVQSFLHDFSQVLNDSLRLIDTNFEKERMIERLIQQKDAYNNFTSSNPEMCRTCRQVRYQDSWIDLTTFLANHPEEVIRSIPSDYMQHECN